MAISPAAFRVNRVPAITSGAPARSAPVPPALPSTVLAPGRPIPLAERSSPRPIPSWITSMPTSAMPAAPDTASNFPVWLLKKMLSYSPVRSSNVSPPVNTIEPALPRIWPPICAEKVTAPTPVANWPAAPMPVPTKSAAVHSALRAGRPSSVWS